MNPLRGRMRGETIHLFQAHVTLALCALALIGFVAAMFGGSSVAGRRDAAMRRADLYYREHPYLDAPLEILIAVEEDNAPTFDANLELDPARFEEEQAELDAIVAEAEAAERDLPAYRLGLAADAVSGKRIALHLFVHAGGWHLIWVLALLASGGARLELLLGRVRYAALIAGASLSGALAHVALAGSEAAPLVGFSAAAAAIAGAFAVRPGDNGVDPLALGRAKRRRSPIRTATLLGLLVVSVGALGQLSSATFPVIALLGGFAFGAGAMFGFARLGWVREPAAASVAPEVKQAIALLDAGDAAGAIEQARARLASGADDALAARALALAVRGRDDAPEALCAAFGAAVDAKQSAAAIALWREASHVALRAASAQLQALGQWLRAAGAPGEARGALLAALGGGDATFAMKLARESRRSDPVLALRAAERALSFATLGDADRKALGELTTQARKEAIATGVITLDAAREEAAAAQRAAHADAAPSARARAIPIEVDPAFGASDGD
ncbi:MAG TPA: rhomboid family intramembrane serine protease, partial [Myxococcota bacterium]|nr:rhomboid family intramembrane serine protease [Myxococcota bacterium]